MSLVIGFGVMLALAHFNNADIYLICKNYKSQVVSFIAGVSIAYLFLYFLPELTAGVKYLDKLLFTLMLIGFSVFHLLEKYFYQHAKKEKLLKDLREIHSVLFFIYHTLLGVVLVRVFEVGPRQGLLFFIPAFFHTAMSSVSLNEVHKSLKENFLTKLVLSVTPLIGVWIGLTFTIKETFFYGTLGFMGGALLYVVIRETLPKEEKGKPLWFVLGLLFYAVLLMIL